MAPEQVRGDAVDGRTDLYALGALVYRMISGDYPHTGKTPLQVLESHLSGIVRPLSESAAGLRLPEGCEGLVRRMLAREPSERPGSAEEVSQMLVRISQRAQSQSSSSEVEWASATWEGGRPEPLPPPQGPTRDEVAEFERSLRRRTVTRLIGALALVAALVFGVRAWQTAGRPAALAVEVEPNDDPPVATPLGLGAEIKGFIGRRQRRETSDRDVYVIEGLATSGQGQAVTAQVSGVPGLDLVLEGYDREGRPLFKVNDGGEGAGERLTGRILTVDPLYVVVRELWVQGAVPSENSTDPYTLRIDRSAP
jgi:serine/threonine-protein kinase